MLKSLTTLTHTVRSLPMFEAPLAGEISYGQNMVSSECHAFCLHFSSYN